VELSISSVEAQLNKYYQMLKQHFSEHEAAVEFMTGHLTNTSFTHQVEVFNMLPGALPNSSAIRTHAGQWVLIAHLHIKDVEDLIQHLGSLWLALARSACGPSAQTQAVIQALPD